VARKRQAGEGGQRNGGNSQARAACTGLALILLVACSSPNPTPTPGGSGSPSASGSPASASPGTGLGDPTTSTSLIKAAVRDGTLTEAEGILYRLYAQWGDPRLPEAYRGLWTEDTVASYLAAQQIERYPAEAQALIRPFLLRPSDPASYWNDPQTAAVPGARGNVLAVATPSPSPSPTPGSGYCSSGWARIDMRPAIPVMIWGPCDPRTGASPDMVKVQGFISALWGPETNLMGQPIGDANVAGDGYSDTTETGDGALDIYLVRGSRAGPRRLTTGALASTYRVPPFRNQASSSYIVIDPSKAESDVAFKSTVAHEFFHSLQDAHNSLGVLNCPYPAVVGPCRPSDYEQHWFSEASATWAEHYFVPEARSGEVYPRFESFLEFDDSLASIKDGNAYDSFMWPLFMQQEVGPSAIADAWRLMEGEEGWENIQDAVNAPLPFDEHFRDFAVRVWNTKLEPGDPIKPRFNADALDSAFPTTPPDKPRLISAEVLEPLSGGRSRGFSLKLPPLWAGYYDLDLTHEVHQLDFDFTGMTPSDSLDVDALVRIADVGWQRRKLGNGQVHLCLDNPADHAEEVILVLSNHDSKAAQDVKGNWTVKAGGPCSSVSGTATYTSLYRIQGDDGSFTELRETMTVAINMSPAPADDPNGRLYIDAGSTFSATVATSSLTHGVPGCDITSAGQGSAGGAFPEPDGIAVGMAQQDDGTWLAGVSASALVSVTTTIGDCVQTYSETGDHDVQLVECDGPEVQDANPARTFNLHCVFTSTDGLYSYSLTGTITFAA